MNIESQMIDQISTETVISKSQVKRTIELLDEGNTIPFIARYRKEMTGELDENQLRAIEQRLQYLRNLHTRKEEVIRLIEEQGKLTEELQKQIIIAAKLQEVEDYYRPYRQKRRTRATVAKERGLEPLAEWIWSQPTSGSVETEGSRYIDEEKGVTSTEEATQGALDILAEQIAEDPTYRQWIREQTFKRGIIRSTAKNKEELGVYEMYADYSEPVYKCPAHRVLAMNRGEREEVLRISIDGEEEKAIEYLHKKVIANSKSVVVDLLVAMMEDSYKRLIAPSVEREIRNQLTEMAEEQAIHIFSENLRPLLLQPPVQGKVILGVDPAYRTGCKLAVIDENGKVLEIAVVYPTPPVKKVEEAKRTVLSFIDRYNVEIIAIGNGTASRETEQFVTDVIKECTKKVSYIIVNEAGASVYSASKLAGEEFPELDVAERSAISIARRLQDPLAELVKIEPKAVGVGQYQHDVSQKKLEDRLQFVVETAVNHVGVDVNTASVSLLQYVSGISGTIAKNIVKQREESGRFVNRKQLTKIPRLGAKTFEQCIGFLRINEGEHPLDQTPIHPESYGLVEKLLKLLQISLDEIGTKEIANKLQSVDLEDLSRKLETGIPTLRDILDSLARPKRDPRDQLPAPIFHSDVLKMEDLYEGMSLQGTVRNVVDFGVFVDIGIKNDGLVHISRMSDRFVKHPMDLVSVGDQVTVWVQQVDHVKERVGLSMIPPA